MIIPSSPPRLDHPSYFRFLLFFHSPLLASYIFAWFFLFSALSIASCGACTVPQKTRIIFSFCLFVS
ncbi:GPI-anchored surface protein, putative [Bodo saltans]|uniref:GPI-anchored surface protein, putative n=1 Tax=Bodo saltans TaxID=75058 RepID=A0A0S4KII2_BODSA|nr:GPI-anchored surface protein, putative [Bodo saltans]|eukprot:CUI14215.1 GPI-anchored surface protein, putative [Bodo saltans]